MSALVVEAEGGMYDQPEKVLEILTAEGAELPASPVLHAVLYRLCAAHAPFLNGCLGETAWDEFAAVITARIDSWPEHQGDPPLELRHELARLREYGTEARIAGCAAVLRSLDRHHKGYRVDMQHSVVDLPEALGGGRSIFLPPPQAPIAWAIEKKLGRGIEHSRHDLPSILGLFWRLVKLEDRGFEARFEPLHPTAATDLERCLAAREVRIGLASPCVESGYEFWSELASYDSRKGTPYRFVSMKSADLGAAREQLDQILGGCQENEIDVLGLPELTLDNDLLEHLQGRLKTTAGTHPALVVCGSFHLNPGIHWVNRCYVLDGDGEILFAQDKHKGFELTAETACASPGLCGLIGIDERGGYEKIRPAEEIRIVDTPIGRLATPICLDYCGTSLRELYVDGQVNLFLVPAMTPRMDDFYTRARELGTLARAASFVINSAWLMERIHEESAARATEESDEDREERRKMLFYGYLPEMKRKGDLEWAPETLSEILRLFTMDLRLDEPAE